MASEYLFTSESVSEGHPDKVADQISDAVLDACLEQDPMSRVAAETLCTTGLVVLAGEITTGANVDYIGLTRDVLKRIGYDNTEYGIDHKGCSVLVGYDKQSQDIAQGVDSAADDELNLGAGDQGLMFGYACDETPTLMPAPIYYAHRLVERQSIVRKNGSFPTLRPDAKSQVTLRYRDGKPIGCDTIVLSTQHAPEMSEGKHMKAEFIDEVIEKIIRPVMPAEWPPREIDKPFLMPVEDVFSITGRGTVATGRIETGIVKVGEEVQIIGLGAAGKKSVVTGVEMFRKLLDQGEAGDNVGLLLRGIDKNEIKRGMVICHPGQVKEHSKFKAEVYILKKEEGGRHTPFHNKYRPQFYIRTLDVTGEITLPEGTEMVMPGDNVTIEVELIYPVACSVGLRFALREGGRTVGAGQITELEN